MRSYGSFQDGATETPMLCYTITQSVNLYATGMYATVSVCLFDFNSTLLELLFVFFHLCYKIYQVLEASKKTQGNYLTLELVKIF